jgi:hypothetical protein
VTDKRKPRADWEVTKRDLIDGTPLRRQAAPVQIRRRTQADCMNALRTMRREMRQPC